MGKFCLCGQPSCPICKGKTLYPSGAEEFAASLSQPKHRRGKKPTYNFGKGETAGITSETPPITPETEGVRAETPNIRPLLYMMQNGKPNATKVCLECGRPYCPECGNPIPVRGEYCKPACRTKAWRKRGK